MGTGDIQVMKQDLAVGCLLSHARGAMGVAALPVSPAMIGDDLVVSGQHGFVYQWQKSVGEERTMDEESRLSRTVDIVCERGSVDFKLFHAYSPIQSDALACYRRCTCSIRISSGPKALPRNSQNIIKTFLYYRRD